MLTTCTLVLDEVKVGPDLSPLRVWMSLDFDSPEEQQCDQVSLSTVATSLESPEKSPRLWTFQNGCDGCG